MLSGETPSVGINQAMRCISTRVLPLPAPASTSTGASGAVTASRCASFNGLRMGERSMRAANSTPGASRLAASLPAVAQLPQREEHLARARIRAPVGPDASQLGDDFGVVEPEEDVELPLLAQRHDRHRLGREVAAALKRLTGRGVRWVAVECEVQISQQVFVSGKHSRGIGQARQAAGEGVIKQQWIPAVDAIAGAGVE